MKKRLAIILSIIMLGNILTGCNSAENKENSENSVPSISKEQSDEQSNEQPNEQTNEQVIERVISLIDSLNSNSTREEYNAAQSAYDELSETEKQKIPESSIDKLAQTNEAIIANEVDSTATLIENLNVHSTRQEHTTALNAYSKLPENAKAQIPEDLIKKLNFVNSVIEASEGKFENLNGKGLSDAGREEPNYIGTCGYAVISSSKENELERTDKFSDKSLWTIPTYEQDKQFWNETDYTLSHKTQIVVIDQTLKHEGYGSYSGYILVEEVESGKQVYINVKNYITKPYWTYVSNLTSAVKVGFFVAEYNQKSDFYPVDRSGEKVVLNDGTIVLATSISPSNVKSKENGIQAIVWDNWRNGYGGVSVYFNEEDLSVIY